MRRLTAVMVADLERTPLGTRSRLAEELCGRPVLRRTVERVCAIRHVERTLILCPPNQEGRIRSLLGGLSAEILTREIPPAPWERVVQPARKWSLDAWRGGVGGTSWLDEFIRCDLVLPLLPTIATEWLLFVPAAAAALDPAMADCMAEGEDHMGEETRMRFAQAPPGLTGVLMGRPLVAELGEKRIPPGWLLSFKPDDPRRDLAFFSCCVAAPKVWRRTPARMLADADAGMAALESLFSVHDDPSTDDLSAWLAAYDAATGSDLPREVEIELTTEDPFPHAPLLPRGERVGRRGVLDWAVVEKLAKELGRKDDRLVVLGGFGDPLRHPHFPEVLHVLRQNGVYGIAVRTAGADLSDGVVDALLEHRVDILNVLIDRWREDQTESSMGDEEPKEAGDSEKRGELQGVGSAANSALVTKKPSSRLGPAAQGRAGSTSRCMGGLTAGPPSDAPCEAGEDATFSNAALIRILQNLDRFEEKRREAGLPAPILVPEMIKARSTLDGLPGFFDDWMRKVGAVSIVGYSHRAGQLPDLAVMFSAPPHREPCRRIRRRCVILADGRVTACDQDFRGLHPMGDLTRQTLQEIWTGPAFTHLRQAHAAGRWQKAGLCNACEEWHRP